MKGLSCCLPYLFVRMLKVYLTVDVSSSYGFICIYFANNTCKYCLLWVGREPFPKLCVGLEKLVVLGQSLLMLRVLSYAKLFVSRKFSLPKDMKALKNVYILAAVN